MSGFSIPEIPTKQHVSANNIGKSLLFKDMIDAEAIPFAVTSICNNTDFESTDILFANPKALDFNTLMLVKSKSKVYLGKPFLVDAKTIKVGNETIKLLDITNSYEVIGVYHELKKESLEDRVKKLEQQMLEVKSKLEF